MSSIFELHGGQRIAVIFSGVIGTVSALSVMILLLHLFIVSCISGRSSANKDERIFLRMHLGAFVVCLLCSDFIQGISGVIQLYWAHKRHVHSGAICTAQAAMLLFGDNGTAFWNSTVAIHTFYTVVLGKRMSTLAVAFFIATGWTLSLFLVVIGPLAVQTPERGPFYDIAGAWCFVTSKYKIERILVHYLPMLISAFTITVLYFLVALVLFGVLVVDGNGWRLRAPPNRKRTGWFDFFGQFSWSRLARNPHHTSSSSFSPPSVTNVNSIRLGNVTKDVIVSKPDAELGATKSIGIVEPDSLRISRPPAARKVGTEYEIKPRPTTVYGTQMSTEAAQPVQPHGIQLKALAIKMLWYPVVYIGLVLPIAVSRIAPNMQVSLNVMLAFLCLLYAMGTANTIIYVCTRRLGPTPWARRRSRSRSISQSRPARLTELGTVQIFVDRTTHHEGDNGDRFIDITKEKYLESPSTPESLSPRMEIVGDMRTAGRPTFPAFYPHNDSADSFGTEPRRNSMFSRSI